MLPVGSTNISESKINHSISPQWKKQLQNLWPVTWLWQPLIQCLEMPVIRWVFWSWRTDICHRRRLDNLWGLIRLAGGVIIYAKQDVFCFIKRNVESKIGGFFNSLLVTQNLVSSAPLVLFTFTAVRESLEVEFLQVGQSPEFSWCLVQFEHLSQFVRFTCS